MRHVYRDIIAASSAGEGMFELLAAMEPISRIDVGSIAWTGDPAAPVAIRRDQSWGRTALNLPPAGSGCWMRFARNSALARIIAAEHAAYYPDAQRSYSCLRLHGQDAYLLVLGNWLIAVSFVAETAFTRLRQQRNSLLDMIAQTMLDFLRRQIRYYQDQIVASAGSGMGSVTTSGGDIDVRSMMGEGSEAANQARDLLERNARVIAGFFDIVRVEYLMAPDISKLVLFRQVLPIQRLGDAAYHQVEIDVGPFSPGSGSARLRKLEFPMPWGSNNEDDKFLIRLYSYRDINDNVRKALALGQVLIKCKEQVESLFDRRYREYRIYQDNQHFERCKQVRNQVDKLATIRQYLHDSVAEYEEEARTLDRSLIFPRFDEWRDKLALVLKDVDGDILEFRDEIRLRDLREYTYLNMKVPPELRQILIQSMDPEIYILVESEHPVLSRMGDVPANLDRSQFEKKQIFFNNAATISILYPHHLQFRFNRLRGKFLEFLESMGEGFGRLFMAINTQTGIKNRTALAQSLEYLVQQVAYSNQVVLDVSSLDICSFKIFNELFGHPFGDRVIRHVAHRLDDCSPGYAFHVSGDEYYVVHCYHQSAGESWMQDFFASRDIIPEDRWRDYRSRLDTLCDGVAVRLPLTDVSDQIIRGDLPLGTYRLADFIGNFFTLDSQGRPGLKKYSRTGNDYQNVILDHHGRIQSLVDLTWMALEEGRIALSDSSFASFVLKNNCVGDHLDIIPTLTIGTVSYNWKTILPYVSDIIDAADQAAGKNKK